MSEFRPKPYPDSALDITIKKHVGPNYEHLISRTSTKNWKIA